MGINKSKIFANDNYNISIHFNNEIIDNLKISNIKFHNNTNYIYLNPPKIFSKSNTIRNFKLFTNYNINKIYKSSIINVSLDKSNSKKYVSSNKEILFENTHGNEIEVVTRYNDNFVIKEILVKI